MLIGCVHAGSRSRKPDTAYDTLHRPDVLRFITATGADNSARPWSVAVVHASADWKSSGTGKYRRVGNMGAMGEWKRQSGWGKRGSTLARGVTRSS